MAKRALTAASVPRTFDELLRSVQTVLRHGRAEIESAWVQTYREIGRLITVYVLEGRDRAKYGGQVYDRLAERTGMSARTLRECAQFQRCFPIWRKSAKLVWSHYALLCQVADPAARENLLRDIERHDWNVDQLKTRVRALNAAIDIDATPAIEPTQNADPAQTPLASKLGTPGLHPIVARDDGLAVDLGFQLYRPLDPEQARRYAQGDIVRRADDGAIRRDPDATKADLFTYRATLRRVIDGDTLLVAVVVAPGHVRDLEVRLRGIDCAELNTAEGKAAKRFVQSLFDRTTAITITTTKSDKYDRYLADGFLDGDFSGVTALDESSRAAPLFLNNVLLALGHARRYGGTGPKPWAI
jgi:endonuclease YncB( thermonuclease family)